MLETINFGVQQDAKLKQVQLKEKQVLADLKSFTDSDENAPSQENVF